MTVQELNREQLNELKQAYATQRLDEQGESISYRELIDAVNIPDEEVFEYYADTDFVEEDFSI